MADCFITRSSGRTDNVLDIESYEIYLKSIMQLHITQDSNNLGNYVSYNYRNGIPIPQKYPKDIIIKADEGYDFTYQFYKTNRTGIANLILNGTWNTELTIPANTYFCLIIRHKGDSGKTTTSINDSNCFSVTLKETV